MKGRTLVLSPDPAYGVWEGITEELMFEAGCKGRQGGKPGGKSALERTAYAKAPRQRDLAHARN